MNSIAAFRQSSLLITFNSSGLDRSTDPWPLHFLFSVSTTQFIIIKKVIYICNICIHELIFIVAPSSFYAPESWSNDSPQCPFPLSGESHVCQMAGNIFILFETWSDTSLWVLN